MDQDIAVDLYCGLGGWAEGFLAENFFVVGFDVERHDYGTGGYPGQLVLQDVLSLHGRQFKDAAVIVASPPCTEPSYRAMPWKRAKALNAIGPPHKFIELFQACFRIQREASEAAGRHIPLIVENVVGAQRWVGRAKWHFGSYYLWGDIPALMPIPRSRGMKLGERNCSPRRWDEREVQRLCDATKNSGQDWNRFAKSGEVSPHWRMEGAKQSMGGSWYGDCEQHKARAEEHIKQGGDWFGANCETSMSRMYSSKSPKRKAASAMIAKIPFPLARHIAHCFRSQKAAVGGSSSTG